MSAFCTKQLSPILRLSYKAVSSAGSIKSCYPLQKNLILYPVTTMSKPIQLYSTTAPELSKSQKLKQAFKDYGATLFIFHIGMSLCSLGVWYLIVSSGIDVPALLRKINVDESKLQMATGASTFVVAYGLHKMTAPIRISITLGSAPFIVNYLRRIGILKVKKSVQSKPTNSTSSTPQEKS